MPFRSYILFLFLTTQSFAASTPWVRIVKAVMPWGAAEFVVYSVVGDTFKVRYCGSILLNNPEELEKTGNIDSICPILPDAPEITAPLANFKSAMKQIFLVPKPPLLAVPLTAETAAARRNSVTPENLRQKEDVRSVQRLVQIKDEIEGIGISLPVPRDTRVSDGVKTIAGGGAIPAGFLDAKESIRSILADIWTYYLVRQYDQSRKECLSATCAALPSSTFTFEGVRWELVARKRHPDGRYSEVWKDTATGLLWGDRLDGWYRHSEAVSACASSQGKRAGAELPQTFSLPSAKEFEQAYKNGLNKLQPYLAFNYWGEAVAGVDDLARVANFNSHHHMHSKYAFASVRCVTRNK